MAIHVAELSPSLPVPLTSDHAEEPVTFDNWDPAVSAAQSTEVLKSRDVSGQDDENMMKRACIFVLAVFAFAPGVFGQDDGPVIRSEATSAFVWGQDSPSGAISSTMQDPRTGNAIHAMRYDGIEVSSRMGFERVGPNEAGIFLNYTATIVNGTDSTLSVRYGGISIDGHSASPAWVVPADKKFSKKERKSKPDAVELAKIQCLASGFLSGENLFSADASSHVLTVAPRSGLTVSSVIRDPRTYHSVLCSVEGCYPTGTIRYFVNVKNKDYVFVWPGRSAVYCGK